MTNNGPLNIALIAPIEPYRSGIAKHSTQIAKELFRRDNINLHVTSFSRMYPKFLFPGESDIDKTFDDVINEFEASYLLDAINPLSWRSISKKIIASKPDLVIMPAWTFFLAPCFGYIARQCKKANIAVTMIIHNAYDHEGQEWKKKLMRYQLNKATYFLCHNQALANDLINIVPNVETRVSPHPLFDQYPQAKKKLRKRASLELLFFGLIRDYKGLDILIDALAQLKHSDFHLTIAGECWDIISVYEQQIKKLNLEDKVELINRYVSDEEAAEYFVRCDAVILPYRSMTGTGVIPLAFHYGKPVITSELQGFKEIINDKNGVIANGVDSHAISKAIESFQTKKHSITELTIKESAKQFSWEIFCDELLQE